MQAFRILPVKDLNEVTHHILECMDASIHYATKVDGEASGTTVDNATNTFKSAAKGKTLNEEVCENKLLNTYF